MKLEGRVALVTGAGRNIGRATALKFAAEGANVVVNARGNAEEVEAVAAEVRALGVDAMPALADVSDRGQVDRMVSDAMQRFGRIDILVNNAAIRPSMPFAQFPWADWERVRGVILDGAIYCTQAVIPSMVERSFGRIIFLSGDGAHRGGPQRAHVSAAKLALTGLARGLATEFGPQTFAPTSSPPAASIPPGTCPGIPGAPLRPRAFPSGGRAPPTRSPPRACSSSQRTPATSPDKPCTSTAASTTTEPVPRPQPRAASGAHQRLPPRKSRRRRLCYPAEESPSFQRAFGSGA